MFFFILYCIYPCRAREREREEGIKKKELKVIRQFCIYWTCVWTFSLLKRFTVETRDSSRKCFVSHLKKNLKFWWYKRNETFLLESHELFFFFQISILALISAIFNIRGICDEKKNILKKLSEIQWNIYTESYLFKKKKK